MIYPQEKLSWGIEFNAYYLFDFIVIVPSCDALAASVLDFFLGIDTQKTRFVLESAGQAFKNIWIILKGELKEKFNLFLKCNAQRIYYFSCVKCD